MASSLHLNDSWVDGYIEQLETENAQLKKDYLRTCERNTDYRLKSDSLEAQAAIMRLALEMLSSHATARTALWGTAGVQFLKDRELMRKAIRAAIEMRQLIGVSGFYAAQDKFWNILDELGWEELDKDA